MDIERKKEVFLIAKSMAQQTKGLTRNEIFWICEFIQRGADISAGKFVVDLDPHITNVETILDTGNYLEKVFAK